jgi:O-antigen ligase
LNLSHPHNVFLDLWTRLGLVGLLAGIAALVTTFVAGWRLFASSHADDVSVRQGLQVAGSPDSAQKALRAPRQGGRAAWPVALGLLGGLAATAAHGLIDNSLFLPDLMGWFVAAAGIFWLLMVREER